MEIMAELNAAGQAKVFAPTQPAVAPTQPPAPKDTKAVIAAALGFVPGVAQQTVVPGVAQQTIVPAVAQNLGADPAFDEFLERKASELSQAVQQLNATHATQRMHTATVQETKVEVEEAEGPGPDVPVPPLPSTLDVAKFNELKVKTNAQTDVVIYSALVVATMGLLTLLSLAIIRACYTVLNGSRLPKDL